ncbi:MAG: ABC-2 family transporter protein [Holophagales bacterium]|nr:ABC-2 family transporter protein [Holophagales bacterium]
MSVPYPATGGVWRYVRLYAAFLRFSFSKAMEFRVDFYFRVVMDIAFYAVHLAFFTLVYRHTSLLGGWDLHQVYIFVCGSMFVDALHMTVFANNMWWLPIYINRGDLDYYLVRPVSPLFFLSLREFAANSFLNLILASALVAWALLRFPEPLGAGQVSVYLALLLVGGFLHYLLRMVFIIPVFWLHSNRGLDETVWPLYRLSERPHQIYPRALRWLLVTVLPFAFLASVPAHTLFDGLDGAGLLHILLVTAGLFAGVVAFWRWGLRSYASASS